MHQHIVKAAVLMICLLAIPAFAEEPLAATNIVVDVCDALSFPALGTTRPPSIKASDQSVRVLAFGDFGDGGPDQQSVAAAMLRYHKDPNHPFDFGITLGDNFYGEGLNSPTLARWNTHWEVPYGPLGIRIYASLGNHDYYDPASPIAEALYSQRSKSWCLPSAYYTFTAGPVQFFVLDTDWIMRARGKEQNPRPALIQKTWLNEQLKASTSPWKVVYGHHPIYSTGKHGDNGAIVSDVLPLLKQRADVYLAGHDHDFEVLRPEGGVHFFVSGAGGHDKRNLTKEDPQKRRLWGRGMKPGFSVLEADETSLAISFFDTSSSRLCKVTLTKGKSMTMDCPNSD